MTALHGDRIRHTVSFALSHPPGSPEADFLEVADRLGAIPGVEAFELLREVSPKNDFQFGISMEFASTDAYSAYNNHPEHVRFVQERWLAKVIRPKPSTVGLGSATLAKSDPVPDS